MAPSSPSPGPDKSADVDVVAARMAALLEPRIRVAAMAELLVEGPREDLVTLLACLIARAGDASSGYRTALDAVLLVLTDPARLGYERRADLYATATEAGRPEVALLFFEAAPRVCGTEKLERQLADERPLVPTGRPLPLGERKSLARGHSRDLLIQLLRDPHPAVIAILLDNPHLTEGDVLKVASRRPMLAGALSAVFFSDRWRARSPVRRALVLNPYTPLPLAARLMTTLADGDLASASVDPSLAPRLRQHAAEILSRRRSLAHAAPSPRP
jgi:hypothetical protein